MVSALLTIVLVLAGYTYWAIAWQQVSLTTVRVAMLWLLSRWQPTARPDFDIIRKIFSFSVFLLGTSILNIVVKYIYNLKIPIAFSKEDNGYYDRARKFQDIPSTVVTSTIVSVAYPILSELNGDKPKQLSFFRKIVRVTAFMIFPIMLGLIGIIDNVTTVVLTDKWASMIPYFRILCIAGIFLPFQSFCLTTLNALGKSNLNFTLELGRNLLTLALFVLFSGTISQMLWGFSFAMFASYTVNMIIVGKRLGYSVINHLKDILPYAVISVAMCMITILIGRIDIHIFAGHTLNTATILLLQTAVAIVFYSATTYVLGSKVIRDCIELVVRRKK
jgi:polysaccharide biosynthesis protein